MFLDLLIFIYFVLISLGKTKFSKASCTFHEHFNSDLAIQGSMVQHMKKGLDGVSGVDL